PSFGLVDANRERAVLAEFDRIPLHRQVRSWTGRAVHDELGIEFERKLAFFTLFGGRRSEVRQARKAQRSSQPAIWFGTGGIGLLFSGRVPVSGQIAVLTRGNVC